MRIIIEDDSKLSDPAQAQPRMAGAQMEDHMNGGGAPSSQQPGTGPGTTGGQTAPSAASLQDGGMPPGWLAEMIRREFEKDPNRFDITGMMASAEEGQGSTANGGGAPELDSQ
ncbi:MAG: hypothetical protein EHM21_02940 [Chloroflexi bacterium]|nr:MAG: hypothetical protein EHM21_02940 [Chloroflexota bacterium]